MVAKPSNIGVHPFYFLLLYERSLHLGNLALVQETGNFVYQQLMYIITYKMMISKQLIAILCNHLEQGLWLIVADDNAYAFLNLLVMFGCWLMDW